MRDHLKLTIPLVNVRLRASFWFFMTLALFAIFVERHLLLWYIALPIVVHELGHLIAMAACNVRVTEIHFTPVSLQIRGGGRGVSHGKELAVALGGVAANLMTALCLWLFAFQSMRTILLIAANLAVAAFNLLPIGNLDGGRVVEILCERYLTPEAARRVSLLVNFLALVPLSALSVYLFLDGGNFSLALVCGYLAVQIILQE
ncbi:MAG: site-2 protease family protein [Oscillospiraceae bacterium]|nr:site-2 protease family protein [Oscillospiraceae bacterium]